MGPYITVDAKGIPRQRTNLSTLASKLNTVIRTKDSSYAEEPFAGYQSEVKNLLENAEEGDIIYISLGAPSLRDTQRMEDSFFYYIYRDPKQKKYIAIPLIVKDEELYLPFEAFGVLDDLEIETLGQVQNYWSFVTGIQTSNAKGEEYSSLEKFSSE